MLPLQSHWPPSPIKMSKSKPDRTLNTSEQQWLKSMMINLNKPKKRGQRTIHFKSIDIDQAFISFQKRRSLEYRLNF